MAFTLFPSRSTEQRSVSYQDVWGTGRDWATWSGKPTTIDALKVSAAIACVREIAAHVAQLPLKTYAERGDSLVRIVSPAVIDTPSARLRLHEQLFAGTVSLALWGNCYMLVVARDGRGAPSQLEILCPDSVVVTDNGPLSPLSYALNGRQIPREDIVHLRNFVTPGSGVGIAPLAQAGLTEIAVAAQEFGRRWFTDGAHPSAIIYSDDPDLTETQATNIKQSFLRAIGRSRQPAVMGSGLKYERIQVAANESQFLEAQRQAHFEMTAVFGIPPSQVGYAMSGSSITYENRESASQAFLTRCLNGYLVAWQVALSELLPRPHVVRFTTGALLRSDLKTRYEAHKLGIEARFLTPNEARQIEDMPPIDGGDAFAVTTPARTIP
jgi:HK97 family phage portal protein